MTKLEMIELDESLEQLKAEILDRYEKGGTENNWIREIEKVQESIEVILKEWEETN